MHLLLSRHPARCCLEELLLRVSGMLSGDLVAVWDLDLSDGVHRIQFSHGTTTGKRLVCVNGQVRSKFNSKSDGKCQELCSDTISSPPSQP